MATKKNSRLGKGMDVLFSDNSIKKEEANENGILKVDITKVEPNRKQPRKSFDEDALYELSSSIKQHGILEPLLVKKNDDYYEIIAGERRWRAAKEAGLKEVPVIVKDLNNQQIFEISLIENLQREDLNAIEEAIAYKRLADEFNLTQDQIAEKISKSRTTVTNSMRLLKLDERVQQMVIDEKLSAGHVRALLAINDKDLQYHTALQIFDHGLSVRDTEKLIKNMTKEEKKSKKTEFPHDYLYRNVEDELKNILGTKVKIKRQTEKKGKIEIEYYSADELERITDLIKK